MDTIVQILARELEQSETNIQNVVNLIDEGNTIPFIARYRKELHGAAHWPTVFSICAIWRRAGRRSNAPLRARGS